ncbi:hypothetical protein SASPL_106901 [Salvia splendens]|uniref:Mediator of RNA polymerase II transcription subunit 31 n=1 Tax=Salvia splendens TaxID=180675 RepID=A0A8X9A4U6_SALSN|nr:hypothetical protein SASPL_106901 [Salvia splendens]
MESDPMEVENPPSPNVYKDPDDGRQRFLLELEFVQCLANPTYIHYLAQNRYPHCLFFLELLENANFRNAMAHPVNKELAHRQQFYFWKNYRNNRLKHIPPKSLPESSTSVAPASAVTPALPPTTIPAAASSIPPASPQAPSPMQYGSTFVKNDLRSSGVEKRKRK